MRRQIELARACKVGRIRPRPAPSADQAPGRVAVTCIPMSTCRWVTAGYVTLRGRPVGFGPRAAVPLRDEAILIIGFGFVDRTRACASRKTAIFPLCRVSGLRAPFADHNVLTMLRKPIRMTIT